VKREKGVVLLCGFGREGTHEVRGEAVSFTQDLVALLRRPVEGGHEDMQVGGQ
jgi:hypothetical protein